MFFVREYLLSQAKKYEVKMQIVYRVRDCAKTESNNLFDVVLNTVLKPDNDSDLS